MPRYTFQARDETGRVVVEQVQAPSAEAAIAGMRARGWLDPKLLHDDSGTGAVLRPELQANLEELTPEERGELLAPKPPGRFLVDAMWLSARTLWGFLAVGVAYLLWRRWEGDPVGPADVITLGAMLAPFAFIGYDHFFGMASRHVAYERAMADARYEDAIALAGTLAPRLQPNVADFLRARPLAALKRLDEALALCERHRSDEPEARVAYLTQVAILYGCANRFEEQRRTLQELIAVASDKTIPSIDAAQLELIAFREVDRAEAMLAPCRDSPLPSFAGYLWPMLDGIIAFERGDHAGAIALLAAAERHVRATMKTTVGLDRLLTLIEAYEILTIAASGRGAEARARFVAAERRLILLDHPVLLRRCEEAFSASPVA